MAELLNRLALADSIQLHCDYGDFRLLLPVDDGDGYYAKGVVDAVYPLGWGYLAPHMTADRPCRVVDVVVGFQILAGHRCGSEEICQDTAIEMASNQLRLRPIE